LTAQPPVGQCIVDRGYTLWVATAVWP